MDISLVWAIINIIIIDIVLSGDNAVVIAMAAHRLTPEQRKRAIMFGAAGAVGLRIAFTAVALYLLSVPLLQFIGALLLFWITFKLIADEGEAESHVKEAGSFMAAIWTIVVADAIMSLDNILAVAGAAVTGGAAAAAQGGENHGTWLLIFGLALSIPIIMFGSNLIATMMNRLPWLAYVGALILGMTAARMMLHDAWVGYRLENALHAAVPFAPGWVSEWIFIGIAAVGVTSFGHWWGKRKGKAQASVAAAEHHGDGAVSAAAPAGPLQER